MNVLCFSFCSANSLLPSSYIPLLCQSVELASFHFPLLSIWTFPQSMSSLSLNPSIPQAACCVGEGRLPLKMSGLAVLLPCSSSIDPSLPAWMRHHHLVREGMQCMVHNLHFHRVVGWQVPQRTWGGKKSRNAIFNYEAPFNRSTISLTGASTSCVHSLCVLRCASDLWWCQWGPGHESSSAAWPESSRRHSS